MQKGRNIVVVSPSPSQTEKYFYLFSFHLPSCSLSPFRQIRQDLPSRSHFPFPFPIENNTFVSPPLSPYHTRMKVPRYQSNSAVRNTPLASSPSKIQRPNPLVHHHQQKNLYTFFQSGHALFSSTSCAIKIGRLKSLLPVSISISEILTIFVRNQSLCPR